MLKNSSVYVQVRQFFYVSSSAIHAGTLVVGGCLIGISSLWNTSCSGARFFSSTRGWYTFFSTKELVVFAISSQFQSFDPLVGDWNLTANRVGECYFLPQFLLYALSFQYSLLPWILKFFIRFVGFWVIVIVKLLGVNKFLVTL